MTMHWQQGAAEVASMRTDQGLSHARQVVLQWTSSPEKKGEKEELQRQSRYSLKSMEEPIAQQSDIA